MVGFEVDLLVVEFDLVVFVGLQVNRVRFIRFVGGDTDFGHAVITIGNVLNI